MFLLSFFHTEKKNYLTFPIDTTHCNIELAFDCFVFSFSWVKSVFFFFLFFFFFATTFMVLKPVLCFHMTSFNYGAKGVRDVDPACRCYQSNIVPDSIFSVNIAQCVTCLFVFCFVLFYVCLLRGDILGSFYL